MAWEQTGYGDGCTPDATVAATASCSLMINSLTEGHATVHIHIRNAVQHTVVLCCKARI